MPKRVKKPGNSDNQEAVSKKAKTEVKEIDHDKQAAEIIKQQNQAKTQTNEPVNVIRSVVITDSGLVQKRQDSGPSVDPPSQGTTVEKKVASVSDGTCNGINTSQKPSNYISISDSIPLGASISVKVKNKIWANITVC